MVLTWDGYAIDSGARRLTGPDGDIHVEPQVFDVLMLLVDERDRVVSKAEILERVWGDQFVSESALTTRIKQARQGLGDDGRTQRYIRNVHGRGYQFVGSIDDSAEETPGHAATSTTTDASSAATPTPVDLASDIAVDDDFPFVGRADELAEASDLIASGKGGATVLVAGRPGTGKSRLAVEVLERAAATGARVAAGRCEREVTSALQAVRDAFGQVAAIDPDGVATWAAGVEGPLLTLLPSLASVIGDHQPVQVDAYAGIEVFLTVLDRLSADRPIVLLIDDLQWSDKPTRTFLDRIGRRLSDRPIAVVVTHRVGRADLPPEVASWLGQRARAVESVSIELAGLEDRSARELVSTVLDDPAETEVDQILAMTETNCLFLTETLRDAAFGRQGAPSMADLIAARLDRQDEAVNRIITAGAALGPEFPFAVACRAAELDPSDGLAAVDRALDAELIHETSLGTRFRFSHQLVPESIAGRLGRAERAALHQRCAAALEEEQATEAQVVLHLLRAVPLVSVDEAVSRARAAAQAARLATQYDLALRILDLAGSVEPPARTRAEILLEAAWILNDLGTPGMAIDQLDQLAASARSNGWPDLFVEVAIARWSQSPYRRPSDRSTLDLLVEALEVLEDGESIERAVLLAKTASFSVFTERLEARSEMVDRALDMARRIEVPGPDLLSILEFAAIVNTCPAGLDRLDEIDPEIERLRAETGRIYFRDAAAPETLAMARADGDVFRRLSSHDRARVAAQPIAEWRELSLAASLAAFEGDIAAARDGFDRAAEIGEAYWGESSHSLHGFAHFFLDVLSGQWERSREALEVLIAFSAEPVFLGPYALALHHQGGRDDEVDDVTNKLGSRQMQSFTEHIVGGNALVGCGELALARNDLRLAGLVEAALEPFADQMLGLPWAPALAASDVLSRLAELRGDSDSGAKFRSRAASVYTGLGAPALQARLEQGADEGSMA